MERCWLIGDGSGRFPLRAAQYARLRAMQVEFFAPTVDSLPVPLATDSVLIAARFDFIAGLAAQARARLRGYVEAGAVLYVGGGLRGGGRLSLSPFADVSILVETRQIAQSCQFTDCPLVPAALAWERSQAGVMISGADGVIGNLEVILTVRHSDARDRATIFSLECGAGTVIYDLTSEGPGCSRPIVQRLADPIERVMNIGPLIAADCARGRDFKSPGAFNLVIDDRPANYDYLTLPMLRQFMEYLNGRCPEVHVDFAWTPNQNHPSRRYVEVLKEFNCGFVWHGFLRHIDHRRLNDPAAELRWGRRLVDEISRRYGICFQPVMVFPFERDNGETVDLLRRHGFVAKAQSCAGEGCAADEAYPEYLRCSISARPSCDEPFVVLYRSFLPSLSYDRMLANAALGLPIIAAAHPYDIALRRIPTFGHPIGSFSYFDPVLDFARAKALRSRQLAEIASEVLAE